MKLTISFLILALSLSVAAQSATVIAEKASLRGTPSDNGKVIDKVTQNLTVEVLLQQKSWFLVQTKEYVGWLHGNTLKLAATAPSTLFMSPETPPTSVIYNTAPTTPSSSSSRTYFRGSRGGCYYINSKGNKTYVDHSLCK